jgi:hypothetical protein
MMQLLDRHVVVVVLVVQVDKMPHQQSLAQL